MRFKEISESAGKIGLVISHVNGKFEDFELVDWKSQMSVNSGHFNNLFNHTVEMLRDMEIDNAFPMFAKFAAKYLGSGVQLGPDYADQGDNDSYIMYPINEQQLGDINEAFMSAIGYSG